jgi:dipeptidyl aminopeptidase/acylaminoacyl peptidase
VHVHLVNVNTAEQRALPPPASECLDTWQPTFSPDGTVLASVCVVGGGATKIYLQDADGRHPRELPGGSSSEYLAGIAWTPDGRSLVYSADHHLWRVPLDGEPRERLLFAQDVETVSVARTGNRLVYAQVRHPNAIYRLDLGNPTTMASAPSRVIASSRGDTSPSMAMDGSIAFVSERSGSPEIWMCDRDGLNPVQLSNVGGSDVDAPHWSPDGQHIAFDVRVSGKPQLYIVDRGGGPPKRFDTGTPDAADAVWSSDGRFIYFSTAEPEAVWKVPAAGGAAVRLTAPGGRLAPMVSGDPARVFFHKRHDRIEMWSVSTDGGDERPVAGAPSEGWSWTVTPHGMYYMTGMRRHFSLMYFDFATQQSVKVADLPSLFLVGGLDLSNDGRTILFHGIDHSEGDIMLVEGWK